MRMPALLPQPKPPHDQEGQAQVEEACRDEGLERHEIVRVDDPGGAKEINDRDDAGQCTAVQHEDNLVAVGGQRAPEGARQDNATIDRGLRHTARSRGFNLAKCGLFDRTA